MKSWKPKTGKIQSGSTQGDKGLGYGFRGVRKGSLSRGLDNATTKGNKGIPKGGSPVRHIGNSSKDAAKGG